MNKLLKAALIICLTTSSLVFVSCSDDSVTNPVDITQAQYKQMQTLTDSTLIPVAIGLLASGMNTLNGVSVNDYGLHKSAAPEGDSAFIIYHPLTGWWEAYLSLTSAAEAVPYYELVVRDSVQFRSVSGNNQFAPNDSTDYVHEIPRVYAFADSEDTEITIDARNDVVYDNLQSDIAAIDGEVKCRIDIQLDTLGRTIAGTVTSTLEAAELEIPIPTSDDEDVCPLSGVITYTLVENFTSQFVSDEVRNTTWSIRLTIVDPETYLVKISAGEIEFDEYQLDQKHVCKPSSGGTAVAKAIQLIRSR